jgi:hypothetical protein
LFILDSHFLWHLYKPITWLRMYIYTSRIVFFEHTFYWWNGTINTIEHIFMYLVVEGISIPILMLCLSSLTIPHWRFMIFNKKVKRTGNAYSSSFAYCKVYLQVGRFWRGNQRMIYRFSMWFMKLISNILLAFRYSLTFLQIGLNLIE